MDRLGARITKTSLDSHAAPDGYFEFSALSVREARLYLTGTFIVPREWMQRWDEGRYVCTLVSERETVTVPLATTRLSQPVLDHPHKNGAYTWSHFSTPGHHGIDLASLPTNDYECFVSFVRSGNVYTSPTRFRLGLKDSALVSIVDSK